MSIEDCYGVIYHTFNNITGDDYIGKSTKKGKKLEKYLGSGNNLVPDIKKYGKENFEKEIICECKDQVQLNHMERLYIALLKPNYNISKGGEWGQEGIIVSKETREKLSKAKKGIPFTEEHIKKMKENHVGMTGKKLSVEHLQAIINSTKGIPRTQEVKEKISKANLGRNHSEEAKLKMSKSKKGLPSPRKGAINSEESKIKNKMNHINRKEVLCVETEEKFNSLREIERKYSYDHSNISKACKNGKLVYGYHWKFI